MYSKRIRSRSSSVSTVSHYELDDRANGFRSPAESKDFSSSLCVQTGSEAHPVSCIMGTGVPLPWQSAAGRDADHPPILWPRNRTMSTKILILQNDTRKLRTLRSYEAKAVPLHDIKALGGREGIAPTHSRHRSRLAWVVSVTPRQRFSSGERTHCTGGWVGPRAGLDTEARGKILSPLPGIESRSPGLPVRSQTLHWLTELIVRSYGSCNIETRQRMKIRAFWDIAPCSLVGVDWRFRCVYCLHHQGNDNWSFITLMMKAIFTSETSVYSNETTRRYIPESILADVITWNLKKFSFADWICSTCFRTKRNCGLFWHRTHECMVSFRRSEFRLFQTA
jgi:hypothetical protein